MKILMLRIAMAGVITVGVVALAKPVKAKASSCSLGAYCETKTSPGSCGVGGADPCECYGSDGSEKYDLTDCAFL